MSKVQRQYVAKSGYASNSGWFNYALHVFNTSENILFCFSSYVVNYIFKKQRNNSR